MESFYEFIRSFSPLREETWAEVAALFYRRELGKGELFADSGEVARRVAFLETGVLRAFYRSPAAQEYTKHFFVPPCFVGAYSSLITGRPNHILIEALTPAVIWEADFQAFSGLYPRFHDLETAARKMAEGFFVQKEKREVELVLLEAKDRYRIFQEEHPGLEQLIPQYHIASYLGITPTQLSRIRSKMAQERD